MSCVYRRSYLVWPPVIVLADLPEIAGEGVTATRFQCLPRRLYPPGTFSNVDQIDHVQIDHLLIVDNFTDRS